VWLSNGEGAVGGNSDFVRPDWDAMEARVLSILVEVLVGLLGGSSLLKMDVPKGNRIL
jgi:hypothetical protein